MEDEPDKISITICGDGGCGMFFRILLPVKISKIS
jgi:hypothetical protein